MSNAPLSKKQYSCLKSVGPELRGCGQTFDSWEALKAHESEAHPTSNLVTRLRDECCDDPMVPFEAADEIERLRADWELAKPQLDRLIQVETERARLRAAMEQCYSIWSHYQGDHAAYVDRIADIINRALSGDSSAPETKAQPDTNKNRIVLELRDRAGQCYRHDDGLADLLLRAAEWINRLQLPQVETAALSEAETLLQAWADLLPPNGKLYWQHVEKAREYFRRRGLTQETKPEPIKWAGTDEELRQVLREFNDGKLTSERFEEWLKGTPEETTRHPTTNEVVQAFHEAYSPEKASAPHERVWHIQGAPDCEKCGGAGWLRGRELDNPSEDTYADTMTKYTCDGEKCLALNGKADSGKP